MANAAFDQQRRNFISTSMVVASDAAVAGSGLLGSARAQAPDPPVPLARSNAGGFSVIRGGNLAIDGPRQLNAVRRAFW